MSRLDEATLLAYADGQLDPARAAEVEAALADDPEAQETLRVFRESAALVAGRFDAPLQEPVPAHLLARVRGESGAGVVPFPGQSHRTLFSAPTLAMAASLALLIGFGGGWFFRELAVGSTAAPLQQALETAASGSTLTVGAERIMPLASFHTADGRYCREYEHRDLAADQLASGIACRGRDGRWQAQIRIDRALLDTVPPDPGGGYLPAGGPQPDPLAAAAERLDTGPALSPEREQQLLAQGWTTP